MTATTTHAYDHLATGTRYTTAYCSCGYFSHSTTPGTAIDAVIGHVTVENARRTTQDGTAAGLVAQVVSLVQRRSYGVTPDTANNGWLVTTAWHITPQRECPAQVRIVAAGPLVVVQGYQPNEPAPMTAATFDPSTPATLVLVFVMGLLSHVSNP